MTLPGGVDVLGSTRRAVAQKIRPGGGTFTGRRRALGELVHWVEHQPADGSVRVVAGGQGSGKSALLTRLVALVTPGGPYSRSRVQGEHPTVVAVRATGLDQAQFAHCIAAALSSTAEEPSALIRAVRDRCVIVVDALDEAATPADAWTIATRLLVPLVQVRGVKVLVGAHLGRDRSLMRVLGRRPAVIDLDHPPYFQLDDLIGYSAQSLRLDADPSVPSPYRDDPAATARVATAIAEAAQPSFLVAGLAARTRAHDPQMIDTSVPGWQQRQAFPVDADMAIAEYLDGLDDPKRAFDLLVPVAYARHPGLPSDTTLWVELAQAYSGNPYGPGDLDWLLASAASCLLEETEEDGRRVVRLFHQALVDHLRSSTQASMVERTVTSVLRQRAAAAGGWLHAEPYARAHTASHAAQAGGGLLDGLATNPAFLLAADRRTLLRALPAITQPQARRAGRCYRAGAHRLTGDTAADAAYLELVSRSAGDTTLAERIRGLGQPQPFTTQLARGREAADADLVILQGHTGQVYAVAWGALDGTPVLASAGADATIRLWDPADGTQLRVLHGHTEVYALAWGAPVLASGGADATVRLWDPCDGAELRVLQGHRHAVYAVAWGVLGGAPVLASASGDATVRLWDPCDGAELCVLHGHTDEIYTVAWGALGGAPVLASAGADATIRLWDPLEGTELRVLHGHTRRVWSVAWGTLGAPVLASASGDATVRVWDPANGAELRVLHGYTGQMYAVAWGALDGAPVLASAGDYRTVRVWNPADGAQLRILQGHSGWVWTVDWSTVEGTSLLATAGDDRTVRVWNPTETTNLRALHGHTDEIYALAWGDLETGGETPEGGVAGSPTKAHPDALPPQTQGGGAPVLASAGADAAIRLWDPCGGAQRRVLRGHTDGIYAVAWGALGGAPVLASAGADDTIRLWDPLEGTELRVLHGHTRRVWAVAWRTLGAPMLASAGADDTIRLWDPADGAQRRVLRGHTDEIYALAWGALGGRPVLASAGADATIRLWDPADGIQLHTIQCRHTDGVWTLAWGDLGTGVETPEGGVAGSPTKAHPDALLLETAGCGAPVLASAGADDTIRLWDPCDGAELHVLQGHIGPVNALAFGTLDGVTLLASAGRDGTVRLWDLTHQRQAVLHFDGPVHAVVIGPNGRLAVAGWNGVAVLLVNSCVFTNAGTAVGAPEGGGAASPTKARQGV